MDQHDFRATGLTGFHCLYHNIVEIVFDQLFLECGEMRLVQRDDLDV